MSEASDPGPTVAGGTRPTPGVIGPNGGPDERDYERSVRPWSFFLGLVHDIVDLLLDLTGLFLDLATGTIGLALALELLVVGEVACGFLHPALGLVELSGHLKSFSVAFGVHVPCPPAGDQNNHPLSPAGDQNNQPLAGPWRCG